MGRRMKGLICCILVSLFRSMCFAVNLEIQVDGEVVLAETDDNFICATLDWWPQSKCDFNQCPWGKAGILNLDLENKILSNAVKAFNPLRIRVGGSLQDQVVYKTGIYGHIKCPQFKTPYIGLFNFSLGCLDMHRWDQLNNFFRKTGAKITFGLNALIGRKKSNNDNTLTTGDWDPRNALDFMKYTVSKGYKIDSYEFGNKLSGTGIAARVDAEQYGRDILVLNNIIAELYPDNTTRPLVFGPGGFYDEEWFNTFLRTSGRNVVDALTHHIYNLGSGNDPAVIDRVQDPDFLDKDVVDTYFNIRNNIKTQWPWTKAWVSESGGAFSSGSKDVSHTFANGFWYLDQLGMTAKYNHKVFCRQTLIGGNYGLLNTISFNPNPDYYGALLWHRLMGKKVLIAYNNKDPHNKKFLRFYAHCSKDNAGISIVMINLSKRTTFQVQVANNKGVNMREEYHLTPQDGDILSDVVLLNGKQLKLDERTYDIPLLKSKSIDNSLPITVVPHSIVFATLKDFNARACN